MDIILVALLCTAMGIISTYDGVTYKARSDIRNKIIR